MSKYYSIPIKLISMLTLAVFVSAQALPSYAMRAEAPGEGSAARAIGDELKNGSAAADFKANSTGAGSRFITETHIGSYLPEAAKRIVEEQSASVIPSGSRIVDLMSGAHTHISDSLQPIELVGIGLNRAELNENHKLTERIEFDLESGLDWPVKKGSYDAVLVISGMAYIGRPDEFMKRAALLLKPGGILFVVFSEGFNNEEVKPVWMNMNTKNRIKYTKGAIATSRMFKKLKHKVFHHPPPLPPPGSSEHRAFLDLVVVTARRNAVPNNISVHAAAAAGASGAAGAAASGVPEGSMILVPAELLAARHSDWPGIIVPTVNKERIDEEIAAGRIVRLQGKYYVLVQNPLYSFGRYAEGQRSSTFGPTTLKGKGLNEPVQKGGLKLSFTYGKYEQRFRLLNGGLPRNDRSYVEAQTLRYLFREHENDPAMVLAKQYGADIDMIMEPIGEFKPLAFPVAIAGQLSEKEEQLIEHHRVNLPPSLMKDIPENVVLIEADAYLEFIGQSQEERDQCEPVVFYYRAIANAIRVPRLAMAASSEIVDYEKLEPFYKYYGYDLRELTKQGAVAVRQANEKIVMGAAARFGAFIYIMHNYLNAAANISAGSIFSNPRVFDHYHGNTNPLCLFDYDTIRKIDNSRGIEFRNLRFGNDIYSAASDLRAIAKAFAVDADVKQKAVELMKRIASWQNAPAAGATNASRAARAAGEGALAVQIRKDNIKANLPVAEEKYPNIISLRNIVTGKPFELRESSEYSKIYTLWLDGQEIEDSYFDFYQSADEVSVSKIFVGVKSNKYTSQGIGLTIFSYLADYAKIKGKNLKVLNTNNYGLIKLFYDHLSHRTRYVVGTGELFFPDVDWLDKFGGPIVIKISNCFGEYRVRQGTDELERISSVSKRYENIVVRNIDGRIVVELPSSRPIPSQVYIYRFVHIILYCDDIVLYGDAGAGPAINLTGEAPAAGLSAVAVTTEEYRAEIEEALSALAAANGINVTDLSDLSADDLQKAAVETAA